MTAGNYKLRQELKALSEFNSRLVHENTVLSRKLDLLQTLYDTSIDDHAETLGRILAFSRQVGIKLTLVVKSAEEGKAASVGGVGVNHSLEPIKPDKPEIFDDLDPGSTQEKDTPIARPGWFMVPASGEGSDDLYDDFIETPQLDSSFDRNSEVQKPANEEPLPDTGKKP